MIEIGVIVFEFDFGSLKGWIWMKFDVNIKKISNRKMMLVKDDMLNFVLILLFFFKFILLGD